MSQNSQACEKQNGQTLYLFVLLTYCKMGQWHMQNIRSAIPVTRLDYPLLSKNISAQRYHAKHSVSQFFVLFVFKHISLVCPEEKNS